MPEVQPTNNPVPSDNPADARDNFKRIDEVVNSTENLTSPTRTGVQLVTLHRYNELVQPNIDGARESAAEAAASAAAAEAAVSGLDYQGLWPDSGGSADKGDTYQTQVSGTPTGQYFTALQNTTVDPIGDDVNWREVVSSSSIPRLVMFNSILLSEALSRTDLVAGVSTVTVKSDDINSEGGADYDAVLLSSVTPDNKKIFACTVLTDLALVLRDDTQIQAQINNKISISPSKNIVFDMQRDALKSQGAISGEPLTTVEWIVTVSAAIGDTSINIGANTLVAGQLVGYLADDDEYYSSRVKTPGSTLVLHDPLEANVSAGKEVFSFYKDKSHPSIKGYRAIADYMLRQRVYQDISDDVSSLTYQKFSGPETIGTLTTDTFDNCGSSEFPSVRIQTSAQNEGFFTSPVRLAAGDANIELVINTGGEDIRVRVAENDDIAAFIVDEIINTEVPTKITYPIRKKLDSQMIIRMQQNGTGSTDFNFIMKFLSGGAVKIDDINGGTHVLHGDSWFFQEGIFQRLQDRLPNANIINNGVGGRTSTNLAQTIDSEVKPLNPDYVWCVAGTNDAILGVSVSGFHRWMNQAIANIKNIGATPIMFTPAAGNLIDNWLARSRAYLYVYDFRDGEETQFEDVLISFAGVSVPASSEVFCGTAGRTIDSVRVIEAFGNGVNGINFGYSTGMAQPTIDVQTRTGNTIIDGVTVTKSDNTPRYFNVGCVNTTASDQTANGFARVRIKNSVK